MQANSRAEAEKHSCALRALNICDGQQLEYEREQLTVCPHLVLADSTLYEWHDRAHEMLSDRLSRVEPQLPL